MATDRVEGDGSGTCIEVIGDGHGVNGNTAGNCDIGLSVDGAMRKVSSNRLDSNGAGLLIAGYWREQYRLG